VSTSISNAQRLRALQPEGLDQTADRPRRTATVRWAIAAGILAGVSGITLATVEAVTPEYLYLNAWAATCFILCGLAVAVLCIESMLATREEFYRRGELAGWMKGWRGLPPDTDDPLLHR